MMISIRKNIPQWQTVSQLGNCDTKLPNSICGYPMVLYRLNASFLLLFDRMTLVVTCMSYHNKGTYWVVSQSTITL